MRISLLRLKILLLWLLEPDKFCFLHFAVFSRFSQI